MVCQPRRIAYDIHVDAANLRERLRASGSDALRERLSAGSHDGEARSDLLYRARYGCYLVLGFEPEQAFRLATAPEVGIVDALRLVENDCPHATALEILL